MITTHRYLVRTQCFANYHLVIEIGIGGIIQNRNTYSTIDVYCIVFGGLVTSSKNCDRGHTLFVP